MVSLSIRYQFAPLSELRQSPIPTTLIATSPFKRLTATPEHPPGHGGFAPLLVSRPIKALETSIQLSAAHERSPIGNEARQMIDRTQAYHLGR